MISRSTWIALFIFFFYITIFIIIIIIIFLYFPDDFFSICITITLIMEIC